LLIRFSVANYLSFRRAVFLSLVKSRERQLPSHVCEEKISGFQTLRGAVIYGANASGKSNLVSAMNDAQRFIVEGELISPFRAFKLLEKKDSTASTFEFEFTYKGKAFSYGFDVSNGEVEQEWLHVVHFKNPPKLVFSRKVENEEVIVTTGPLVEKALKGKMSAINLLLKTAPKDSLIVTDLTRRQLQDDLPKGLFDLLISPYEWCRNNLTILSLQDPTPPMELVEKMKKSEDFRQELNAVLKRVDPGIESVELRAMDHDLDSFSSSLGLGKGFKKFALSLKGTEATILVPSPQNRRRYVVVKNGDEYTFERMVVVRKNDAGHEVEFELNEESEGTRRVIDLVPLFLRKGAHATIIIDEMERSLHPEVTRLFHDMHYNDSPCLNRQLIMVTHEHHLLSQDFYRRDEVWFTQKEVNGETDLYSLSDFDGLRFDKDIRKDYLLGRYGAVPNI
jgi:uncharacterized protein